MDETNHQTYGRNSPHRIQPRIGVWDEPVSKPDRNIAQTRQNKNQINE